MSVIVDALRRARRGKAADASTSAPAARPVPAGLLAGNPGQRAPKAPRSTRWGMLAGVVTAAAMIYATVRFAPLLSTRAQTVAAGTAVSQPLAAEALAASTAPPATPGADEPIQEEHVPREEQESPALATRPVSRATPAPPAVQDAATTDSAVAPPPGARREPVAARAPLPAPPPLPPPPAIAAPPVPGVNHFEQAVRYHSLGNFEQALTHYLAVLDGDEFNVEARNNLGLLYHERGLVEDAVAQFRRALLINPQYLRARSNLAVVLLKAGRLAEARAELRAALAADPHNVDLLVNMALVDKADGQPEQAKETLLRAIARQPAHAVAHYNLALLYEESGEAARAHDHYSAFLKTAGPEHGTLLSDVRRRVEALRAGPSLQ